MQSRRGFTLVELPNIVNSLLMDGSVRPVSSDIPVAIWQALGTRAGGESVNGY